MIDLGLASVFSTDCLCGLRYIAYPALRASVSASVKWAQNSHSLCCKEETQE